MNKKELRQYLQAVMDEGISMERLEEIYKRGVDDGVRLSEEAREVVMKVLENSDSQKLEEEIDRLSGELDRLRGALTEALENVGKSER